MLGNARVKRSPLGTRRCLSCGYAGRFAQGGESRRGAPAPTTGHCPRCGCDFSVRPPRSYAEMEGLDHLTIRAERKSGPLSESRLVERWIAFLFMATLVVVAAMSLITAMFAPVSDSLAGR